ncbi:MAG: D-galactonate dehydratase, partial [Bacteroidota bacterium]|nr:D-galactonate dehydratase [Bacteroidota bacterium]
SLGIHYNQGSDLLDYLVENNVFKYEKGYVKIPEGAGLGIVINEDHVRKMSAIGHNWRNPLWRHEDGSVAEW